MKLKFSYLHLILVEYGFHLMTAAWLAIGLKFSLSSYVVAWNL